MLGPRRQETLEEEAPLGQAGGADQRGGGARPRYRHHPYAGLVRGRHQPRARVADAGRAGVGDERDRFAARDARDDLAGGLGFVVGMQRDAARARADALKQRPAGARVLGRDHRDGSQHAGGPPAYVFQVTDRRGHYI